MKQYNINELLEKKKDLEKQVKEYSQTRAEELVYAKSIFIDHTNDNKTKEIEDRPRVSLVDFTKKFNSAILELAKVNVAIYKHNADKVIELLQKREVARQRIAVLDEIKNKLPRENKHQRGTSRQYEGKIQESVEIINEPMFSVDDVEKQYNEAAAEERKLNTEIQKINLNAEVELN